MMMMTMTREENLQFFASSQTCITMTGLKQNTLTTVYQ